MVLISFMLFVAHSINSACILLLMISVCLYWHVAPYRYLHFLSSYHVFYCSKGTLSYILDFLMFFFAKARHKLILLVSRVSMSNFIREFSYVSYLSSSISLKALFCNPSRSLLLFSVSELCQTVSDCSKMLLM